MTTCELLWPRFHTGRVAIGLIAGLALAPAALAETPAALDRVPADAPIVIGFDHIGDFVEDIQGLAAMLGQGRDAEMMAMVVQTMNLNTEGSGALAIYPPSNDGPQPTDPVVAILPVNNYADFVGAHGGNASDAVTSVMIAEESFYAKDLGAGYVAMGMDEGLTTSFDGAAGRMATHNTRLGATGQNTASHSDVVFIADIQALRPMLEEGLRGMKENAGMYAAMSGQDLTTQLDMGVMIANNFLRDSQVGVLGLNFGDDGLTLDLTTQFKDGSELAGFFGSRGKAPALMGRLPQIEFMLAGALDMSSPGIRKLLTNYMEMTEDAEAQGLPVTQLLSTSTGFASVLGTTPAIMAGVVKNNVTYFETSGQAELINTMRTGLADLDGDSGMGLLFSTEFEQGAQQVNGVNVDSYSISTQPDPAAPPSGGMGMPNASMINQMLFGVTGGPRGFIAKTEDGVVQTLSRDSALMTKAIDAARGGAGMTSGGAVKGVATKLPEGRTFEAYIGVDKIMNTAGPMMAMMGALEGFEPSPEIAPVGIGGTTSDGGVLIRTFVPIDVLKLAASFAPQEGMDPGDGPEF